MTLGVLNDSQGILTKLLDLPLPFATAYKINLLIKQLQPSLEFYQIELKKLLDIYAEQDAESHYKYNTISGDIQLKPETAQEFREKFEELARTPVEIDTKIFTTEDMTQMEKAGLTITAREISYYNYFMK